MRMKLCYATAMEIRNGKGTARVHILKSKSIPFMVRSLLQITQTTLLCGGFRFRRAFVKNEAFLNGIQCLIALLYLQHHETARLSNNFNRKAR